MRSGGHAGHARHILGTRTAVRIPPDAPCSSQTLKAGSLAFVGVRSPNWRRVSPTRHLRRSLVVFPLLLWVGMPALAARVPGGGAPGRLPRRQHHVLRPVRRVPRSLPAAQGPRRSAASSSTSACPARRSRGSPSRATPGGSSPAPTSTSGSTASWRRPGPTWSSPATG